jgi:hypothetical protein
MFDCKTIIVNSSNSHLVDMRRAIFALTTVLVIVFLAQLPATEANPISHPFILVDSPEHYMVGKVYQETSVDIAAQIHMGFKQYGFSGLISAFYSLDGNSNSSLTLSNDTYDIMYTATGKMANLTDGYHNLRIFALDSNGKELSTSTTFLVNTTFTYPTFLLSPSNITYSKNEVPLEYYFGKNNVYSILTIYYKVDDAPSQGIRGNTSQSIRGNTSQSIRGNTTLTGLSEGQHKISVTALNHGVIYSEQTIYFNVNTTSNQSIVSSNLTIYIVAIFSIAGIGSVLAVIVYKRRRKVSDCYD